MAEPGERADRDGSWPSDLLRRWPAAYPDGTLPTAPPDPRALRRLRAAIDEFDAVLEDFEVNA